MCVLSKLSLGEFSHSTHLSYITGHVWLWVSDLHDWNSPLAGNLWSTLYCLSDLWPVNFSPCSFSLLKKPYSRPNVSVLQIHFVPCWKVLSPKLVSTVACAFSSVLKILKLIWRQKFAITLRCTESIWLYWKVFQSESLLLHINITRRLLVAPLSEK